MIFEFLKQVFVSAMMFFGCNALNTIPLKCVSMNNQECKIRPEIINIISNEPKVYPYSIKVNKCRGSFNNIDNPYLKLCVSDIVKNTNVEVFNLMSRTNETRHIEWHETCKCKCRLDVSVCNNKQCWNNDKCRCECKEFIAKEMLDTKFIWNLSNCECECDKSCDVGEYLQYGNCKFRKRLVHKFVEECSKNIYENKRIYNCTLNDYENVCES